MEGNVAEFLRSFEEEVRHLGLPFMQAFRLGLSCFIHDYALIRFIICSSFLSRAYRFSHSSAYFL